MQSLFMMRVQHFYNIQFSLRLPHLFLRNNEVREREDINSDPDLQGSAGGVGVGGFVGVVTVPVEQEIT